MSAPAVAGGWWIEPGRVLGGGFPAWRSGGLEDDRILRRALDVLLDAGIRRVICLQEEHERGLFERAFPALEPRWRDVAASRGLTMSWARHAIPDMGVPTTDEMCTLLDAIDASDAPAFIHCWGGHGRTGTVAGCLLVRRGLTPEAALAQIRDARAHDPYFRATPSPQTAEQEAFVRCWPSEEAARLGGTR